MAQFTFVDNELNTEVSGNYQDGLPLANITIAGTSSKVQSIEISVNGKQQDTKAVKLTYSNASALYITGLEQATEAGIWNDNLKISLS